MLEPDTGELPEKKYRQDEKRKDCSVCVTVHIEQSFYIGENRGRGKFEEELSNAGRKPYFIRQIPRSAIY